MKTISINEAISLVKSTYEDLRDLRDLRDGKAIEQVVGLDLSGLEIVSTGNHYKFYKYGEDLLLEEFPGIDSPYHYFYLCDSNFYTIGEIGYTVSNPESLLVD